MNVGGISLVISCIIILSCITYSSQRANNNLHNLNIIVAYDGLSNVKDRTISLRGSSLGLNWNSGKMMQPNGTNNFWQLQLQYTVDQIGSNVEMKPLYKDNVWSIGSNFEITIPARNNSYTILYPFFFTHTGNYSIMGSLYSPQLNNSRDIIIYYPPSYYENTLKPMNNVLVMHDGENLFNRSTSFGGTAWGCQDTINQLVNEGKMEEVLIIGAYNTQDRLDEYTYSYDPCFQKNVLGQCQGGGGKGDAYLDFLIETAIPYVKKNLNGRIETNRENLGIMGSSLGGLISCYAGWTRSSVFSKSGCMSSSFWWNDEDFDKKILVNYPPPPAALPSSFYLDSGNCCPKPFSDDRLQTERVRDHMIKLGYVLNNDIFYYMQDGGQHNEYYWGKRFHYPMTDLYPPTVTPTYHA